MPLVHVAGLLLWAGALAVAAVATVHPPGMPRELLLLGRRPGAVLALFSAISLYHHHPTQWFTPAGKARAALILALLALDAALDLARYLPRPRLTVARGLAGLALVLAAGQTTLTWIAPWKT